MPKIAIDASRIQAHRTGIENYALSVVKAASSLTYSHPDWDFTILTTQAGYVELKKSPRLNERTRFQIEIVPNAFKPWLHELVCIPVGMTKLPLFDLFYSPGYPISPFVRAHIMIQHVHDMVPWHYSHTMTMGAWLYWRLLLPTAIRRSERLVVDSRYIASELACYPFASNKRVSVVPLAIAEEYLCCSGERNESESYVPTSNEPYLLAIGTLEPRKNLLFLLKVFEQFLDMFRITDLHLVLVGSTGWKNSSLLQAISSHKYKGHIHVTGWLSDEQLRDTIRSAKALLYPSLYEGFGLPPIEAVALGTPVISSNVAAIPEVMAEYSLYADPKSVEEWIAQIQKVLFDSSVREFIERAGKQWVSQYSEQALTRSLETVFVDSL